MCLEMHLVLDLSRPFVYAWLPPLTVWMSAQAEHFGGFGRCLALYFGNGYSL
jgi:hypothetical protein